MVSKINEKKTKIEWNENLICSYELQKLQTNATDFFYLIVKLTSVSGGCDVGKTVHDSDFKKVISNTLKCFLYQAVTATTVCY
jgi:hypothetical protein